MAIVLRSLHLLMILYVSNIPLNFAQDESQFIYNGFSQANLSLDGSAKIHPNGLLQLTNISNQQVGYAFYQFPVKFSTISSLSFSTNIVFAMVPQEPELGGHGIAFAISPSRNFDATTAAYLGLFNFSNNGHTSNHILAIELDPVESAEFEDIDNNHVGIDVNDLRSLESAPATYYSNDERRNISLELISGNPMQLWIDYDEAEKLLNVTLAPIRTPKPNWPLLSRPINLSEIVLESMYVGFSASTGTVASDHYILGWSFNKSGQAQSLDISRLPTLPPGRKQKEKRIVVIRALLIVVVVVLITITGAAYYFRRKKFEEVREEWESEYGTHRFSYNSLYKATKGFKAKEIIGEGGFGKVYRGTLPSNEQIAVKRVSHDSQQGMKEFVAEIISMGRLRHRNLVRLLGYCRRKGELLLIYDYMPHGSLDRFLYSNGRRHLNWLQRFQILRGVASGLLYLHEGWEQIVIHRDIKAGNVLLDNEMNGRLGDFGLARLYDHDTNSQTTLVAGTVGYLAPELTRTGRATTYTDVYAFGAFMLEVACGRRPIERMGMSEELVLVDWVFECWSKGDILGASDPRLEGNYVVEEMVLVLKIGLLCSHVNPAARPSMRRVMQFLNGDADLPNIPYDSASFGTFSSSETLDFLWSPPSSFVQSSDPSMSSTVSILKGGC
ncbi:probable L-type lectin-domain containing receptor kinase I.6 [Juglans microcarpa x Juglans regia]|uniref:probable L-type lectin-domain containing receptor kinase I.6 n=1 Tax=Juglans microcarpa x Juglans regia TaxID=2249226 RepID=UPI001B7F296C|nr:probable L-type lectin-domain containing receptor kinase I.6 [Juglans microcarpa x Juglans regia]